MTATMSVNPRPCLLLHRHEQLDITLSGLIKIGTVDQVTAVLFSLLLRLRLPALAAEEQGRRADTEPSSAIVQPDSTPPPRWALASSWVRYPATPPMTAADGLPVTEP